MSKIRTLWQQPADLVTMDDSDNNIVSVHLNLFSPADCSGPIYRSRGPTRRPADIPPIDPTVLLDLQRHTQEVAHSVEMMMRSLNGTIQNVSLTSSSSFNKTSDFRHCDRWICSCPDDSSERGLHPDLQRLCGQPGGVCGHEYKGIKPFSCTQGNLALF